MEIMNEPVIEGQMEIMNEPVIEGQMELIPVLWGSSGTQTRNCPQRVNWKS